MKKRVPSIIFNVGIFSPVLTGKKPKSNRYVKTLLNVLYQKCIARNTANFPDSWHMADEKNSKPENIRRAIVISCIIPFTTKTMRVSNP